MSTHFTIRCDTCEVWGPDIRRSGGVSFKGLWPRRHPDAPIAIKEESIQDLWTQFLITHEFHLLRLVRE